jgi:hypothetical protein
VKFRTQRDRVCECSQDVGHLSAGYGESACARSRCNDYRFSRVALDCVNASAEEELDVLVGPEPGRAQEQVLRRAVAGEELLRERRPLVGSDRLLADEGDPAVVALRAQRLRAARAGEPGADDQH